VSEAQENNKALVRCLLEVVHTKGALDAIDELLSADFVDHSLMPGQKGDLARDTSGRRPRSRSLFPMYA
jgi:hypothetical protein